MHTCLQLLIKKFRYLQYGLDEKFQSDWFIYNKLIIACQEVSACQYACFKPSDILADLINDLQSFIIIVSKSHPHQIKNYQSEAYYTDGRYRISYFRRQPQPRFWPRSKSDYSNKPRISYHREKDNSDRNQAIILYNSKKRCFMCEKIGCWSNNHFWKKRNAYRKQLKKRFNEFFKRSNHQSEKD